MANRRFLHLERERREGSPETPIEESTRLRDRFRDAPEPALPSGPLTGTPADEAPAPPLGRVQPERFSPEPAPGIGVDEQDPQALPFARCVHCFTDNSRFVETCQRCGNSLRTPEQDAYNARLAEQLHTEQEKENAALAALRASRVEQTSSDAKAVRDGTRAEGVAIAARERARINESLGDPAWDATDDQTALGLRWLRLIKNPAVRMAVLIGCIGLIGLPWFLGRAPGALWMRMLSFVGLLLFAPRNWLGAFMRAGGRGRWRL